MLILDNSRVIDDNASKKLLEKARTTREGFYVIMTLRDLLKLRKEGLLVSYDNNRSGNLQESRIRDIAEKFNPYGFGQITVAYHNGRLEQSDGHHRVGSVELMNDEYFTFDAVADQEVAVRVVPSSVRIQTYQTLNANKSHTGFEKANNPDLAVGSYADEIIKAAEGKVGPDTPFNRKQTQNLMDLVLAYRDHGNAFELDDVYANRSAVNKLLDSATDRRSFSVRPEVVKKATEFVTKYLSLVFNAETSDIKSEVVALIKSPGFLLIMGLDYLTDGQTFSGFSKESNARILNKVSGRKFAKILEHSQAVARRNRKNINIPALKKVLE